MKTPLNPKEVVSDAIRAGLLWRDTQHQSIELQAPSAHLENSPVLPNRVPAVRAWPNVKLPSEAGLSPARIARPEPVPRVLRNKKRVSGRPERYVMSQKVARDRGLIP
jgi:hypothetical protein